MAKGLGFNMSEMVKLLINRKFDSFTANIIIKNTDSSLLIHRFSKLIENNKEKESKNSWWE